MLLIKNRLGNFAINFFFFIGWFLTYSIKFKTVETSFAFKDGATGSDIVIPLGYLLKVIMQKLYDEVIQIRGACRKGH